MWNSFRELVIMTGCISVVFTVLTGFMLITMLIINAIMGFPIGM